MKDRVHQQKELYLRLSRIITSAPARIFLMDKVNHTLEYTAPCAAFGEQEIILIPHPRRDNEDVVIVKY